MSKLCSSRCAILARFCGVALVLAGAASCDRVTRPVPTLPGALDVKYALVPTNTPGIMISITVQNKGHNTLTMTDGQWPTFFEGPHTTLIAVVHEDRGRQLKPLGIIMDPVVDVHTLQPGECRTEFVYLDGYFEGLMEAAARSDVSVFWTYLPIVDGRHLKRLGGWLLIPRGGATGSLVPRK